MHRVVYTIREIAPAELPTARALDGTTRPATDAELLNLGIARLSGDVYSCVEQHTRDETTLTWAPANGAAPHPGRVLASGSHRERHRQFHASGHPAAHDRPTHEWHGESKH